METKKELTIRLGDYMCYLLPEMTRIQGLQITQTTPDVRLTHLLLQYESSQTPEWCSVEVPLEQIGRLLHLLGQMAMQNPAVAEVLRDAMNAKG